MIPAMSSLLRKALLADALASGASGAVLALGSAPAGALLGLPPAVLLAAGLVSVVYAAFVGWLGTRRAVWAPAVWFAIVGNVAWTLGSLELLFTLQPNTLGQAYVIAQAVLVAALAEMQFIGLRRSRTEASGRAAVA
jgi:hypothetical protein